jgi:hypothetical protein
VKAQSGDGTVQSPHRNFFVEQNEMKSELIICIPGPWQNQAELTKEIAVKAGGEFMFLGMILAHPAGKDHIEMEVGDPDDRMETAFRLAGQRRISEETLNKIAQHQSVAWLHFPADIVEQRERLLKFTEALHQVGGLAVKLESSGVAHEWERWFELLRSDNPFDTYCACVGLIADEAHYYSCGMRLFGLPDVQVARSFPPQDAAELMNQFNYYQIVESPELRSGHTFSLTADSPHLRIEQMTDHRHEEDDLFHNPFGLWNLTAA